MSTPGAATIPEKHPLRIALRVLAVLLVLIILRALSFVEPIRLALRPVLRAISRFVPLSFWIILFFLGTLFVAAYPYLHLWRKAEANKDLITGKWTDKTNFETASAFHQRGVTLLLFILGAGWGVYTWIIQNQNYRASLAPALEVRISARQKTLQSPENFLGKDVPAAKKFLTDNPNLRLIEGSV